MYTFIATKKNNYRKPETGMFEVMKKYLPVETLYYTGDALGRPQDFSDSDKVFGNNIRAMVYSPEDVFPPTPFPDFNPLKEMVVLIGMAGSGKSLIATTHLKTHVRVNQDTLKTFPKVLKVAEETAKTGKSLVIDSTNSSLNTRQKLYDIAEKYEYNVKVLYIVRNGKGWNDLRGIENRGIENRESGGQHRVSTIAYNIYFKNLRENSPEKDNKEMYYIWF